MLRENLAKLIQTASHEKNAANSPENIAATDFDLVGKWIDQQFNEGGGKLVTYSGVVVSQVPGFIEWYMMTNLKLFLHTTWCIPL